MNSRISIYEIIDSKKSKPRYLFYPSSSCLSPYSTGNNFSNLNVIKQRREINENKKNKFHHKRNANIEEFPEFKTDGILGRYYFNYKIDSDIMNKEDIMENNFKKKYKNYNELYLDNFKFKDFPETEINNLKTNFEEKKLNYHQNIKDKRVEKDNLNVTSKNSKDNKNTPYIDDTLRNKNINYNNLEEDKFFLQAKDFSKNNNVAENIFFNEKENEEKIKQILIKHDIPLINEDKNKNKINDYNKNNINNISTNLPQKEKRNVRNKTDKKILKHKMHIFIKGEGGAKAPIRKRKKSKKS